MFLISEVPLYTLDPRAETLHLTTYTRHSPYGPAMSLAIVSGTLKELLPKNTGGKVWSL
jgi:hypothetical protein